MIGLTIIYILWEKTCHLHEHITELLQVKNKCQNIFVKRHVKPVIKGYNNMNDNSSNYHWKYHG